MSASFKVGDIVSYKRGRGWATGEVIMDLRDGRYLLKTKNGKESIAKADKMRPVAA